MMIQNENYSEAKEIYKKSKGNIQKIKNLQIYQPLVSELDQKKELLILSLLKQFPFTKTEESLNLPISITKFSYKEKWDILDDLNGNQILLQDISCGLKSIFSKMFQTETILKITENQKNFLIELSKDTQFTFNDLLIMIEGFLKTLNNNFHGFSKFGPELYQSICKDIQNYYMKKEIDTHNLLLSFEKKVLQLGFTNQEYMKDFVDNFKDLKLKNVKKELLIEVRDMILSQRYDTVDKKASGHPDSLFYFPTTTISIITDQIIDKIHLFFDKYKDESVIDQLINLYIILNPKPKKNQLKLIYLNDLMYISHHLFLMTFQSKEKQKIIQNSTKYQGLADSIFTELIDLSKKNLEKSLEEIGEFSDLFHKKSRLDKFLKQLNEQLNEFNIQWKVVPNQYYLYGFGILYNHLITFIIHKILKISDIGAEDSEILSFFLNQIMKYISPFKDQIDLFVSSFSKFSSVILILEIKLLEIIDAIQSKRIIDMDKKEIEHLIKALFEDTENRSKVLKSLSELDI